MIGALAYFSSNGSIGKGNTNVYNVGIGYDALINGERVYAGVIGANARVSTDNSFVIGGTSSVTRMSVGIGTDSPNQNASLELEEEDKGFLINRLSQTEKNTFASQLTATDEGMMVYDSTAQQLNIWDGTAWMSSGTQNLGLTDNSLSITKGNAVDLSSYLDNTDAQDLSLTSNTLSLTNDGTSVDLSPYLDNTDNQDLTLTSNILALSNDASTIDLSAFLDNTDAQQLAVSGTSLSIDNGNTIDLAGLQDGFEANTDEQNLALSGTSLSIDNGNTIDLADLQDGFEANTDEQNLALSGTSLSIDNGNSIDLAGLQDGFEANTDEQNLALSGTSLSIDNGNTIDLAGLQDGYEANTDEQNLALSGTSLSIDNGNTIDLAGLKDGFEANTDEQTLNFESNILSISNGNSIDFSTSITDNQNLETANLNGTVLEISIENGSAVSVDLAPLMENINSTLEDHETRITQLEADVAYLKGLVSGTTAIFDPSMGIDLYQNIPNPANSSTRIQFYIPNAIETVDLVLYDTKGVIFNKIRISERGLSYVDIELEGLKPGTFYYSMIAEGQNAGSKKMIVL